MVSPSSAAFLRSVTRTASPCLVRCCASATPLRAAPTTREVLWGPSELTAQPLSSWGSSNEHVHESDRDERRTQPHAPERERDAVLRPSLVVERVVDRGHGEDA